MCTHIYVTCMYIHVTHIYVTCMYIHVYPHLRYMYVFMCTHIYVTCMYIHCVPTFTVTCTCMYSCVQMVARAPLKGHITVHHILFQERPAKPDLPWLSKAVWNTCCDMNDTLPAFKGLCKDLMTTPVHCKLGRWEVCVWREGGFVRWCDQGGGGDGRSSRYEGRDVREVNERDKDI